jgi:hypothetical protein
VALQCWIGGVVEVNVLGRTAVATSVLALAVGCTGQGSEPSGAEHAQHSAGQSISEPSTATLPPDQSQLPAEQTISARISDGKVDGVPARVEANRGTRIRIEVTNDRSDELHVHGYDKTVPLTAGSPAAVAFVADLPGVFEVETHDSGLLLFQLVVRG